MLKIEKTSRISSNIRQPVYSPGRFSDGGVIDLIIRRVDCYDRTPGDSRDFAASSVEQTSHTDSSNSGQRLSRRRAGRPTPTKKEPPEKVDEWWMVD